MDFMSLALSAAPSLSPVDAVRLNEAEDRLALTLELDVPAVERVRLRRAIREDERATAAECAREDAVAVAVWVGSYILGIAACALF